MTLLEWIQNCALEDLETLEYALNKECFVIYDDDGKPTTIFSSSAGAQSHPLFGTGTENKETGRYQEWARPQPEFLHVQFIEGMYEWWTCCECGFTGPFVGETEDGRHACMGIICNGIKLNPDTCKAKR